MGAAPSLNPYEAIIFFDGVCNLCSGAVRFVLKRDRKQVFKFASLQSSYAQASLKKFGMSDSFDTIVLLQNNTIYLKSDAALEIARGMTFPWPLMYGFKIFPRGFRNYVYDFIASHRYRWFGKSDQCMVPTPETAKRFVA